MINNMDYYPEQLNIIPINYDNYEPGWFNSEETIGRLQPRTTLSIPTTIRYCEENEWVEDTPLDYNKLCGYEDCMYCRRLEKGK